MNIEIDQTAIVVSNLCKRYGPDRMANDNISLQVARGEILALLGHNGAGKTTLVRQITGELLPTSGDITIFGVDVLRRPREARSALGIVPQEVELFGHLTVQQHLLYFGRLKGLDRPTLAHRIQELMQQLNLVEHAQKLASQLSGGLKRKLLVGMAMLSRPRVLILDEPTTGLDPFSRQEVWGLVRECQRAGTSVLLTTHYMEEAENLADRVGIVSQGRLVTVGTIEQLQSCISSRYKLTYDEQDGFFCGHRRRFTMYGGTVGELQRRVAEMGRDEYNIAKTSLEDIYLELARQPLAAEENNVQMVQ